jgi:hypothetical protein
VFTPPELEHSGFQDLRCNIAKFSRLREEMLLCRESLALSLNHLQASLDRSVIELSHPIASRPSAKSSSTPKSKMADVLIFDPAKSKVS